MSHRLLRLFLLSVLSVFCVQTILAEPAAPEKKEAVVTSPLVLLKDTSDKMVTRILAARKALKIKAQDPLPFSEISKIIEDVLIPQVGMTEIARATLGDAVWSKASTVDQQRFIQAYKTLLITTYGIVLMDYQDQKITFDRGIRGGYQHVERVKINSQISQEGGQPIGISYDLLWDKNNMQWKVVDMSVEGISLLESFRSQFAAELKKGGLPQLLSTLEAHNKTALAQLQNHH